MLILASLSGIQDFLFDVRESGGKQARQLRFRSFRIQLMAECMAVRLLEALRPPEQALPFDRLVFSAAGNVCIDAGDLDDATRVRLREAVVDVEQRLLRETHGRLRLAVALHNGDGAFGGRFEKARALLAREKLRSWAQAAGAGGAAEHVSDASRRWETAALTLPGVWDPDAEAERDAKLGDRLVKAKWLNFWRPDVAHSGGGSVEDVLGVGITYTDKEPEQPQGLWSCSHLERPEEKSHSVDRGRFHVRRLARHVPRDPDGQPIEFVDLAREARGAPMLGVLKADADSLGAAVSETLESSAGDAGTALRKLSEALDGFFAGTLQEEMHHARSNRHTSQRWDLIYTVFSGGDDMLVVGPWNVMLDFAGHMRRLFDARFGSAARERPCAKPLTISAGVAIIKPRYPVHLAAMQAEELLEKAKGETAAGAIQPKDQCAALGQIWKWRDHDAMIQAGRQLADWVDAGVIQRGWLHTLLTLALLRRGEAGRECAGVPPEVATSRLVYHVARNWPRKRDHTRNEAENAARDWIDAILREFDQFNTTTHVATMHLPAIARYAILATRSGG